MEDREADLVERLDLESSEVAAGVAEREAVFDTEGGGVAARAVLGACITSDEADERSHCD